ncbi:MAG: hypothetical protein ACXABY_08820 [Candidatus Thorarchaeota archaeon]
MTMKIEVKVTCPACRGMSRDGGWCSICGRTTTGRVLLRYWLGFHFKTGYRYRGFVEKLEHKGMTLEEFREAIDYSKREEVGVEEL